MRRHTIKRGISAGCLSSFMSWFSKLYLPPYNYILE